VKSQNNGKDSQVIGRALVELADVAETKRDIERG
jgi:hypothetical protein